MEAKINKKRAMSKKAGISYLEILILIVSTFAFCYLIAESFESVSAASEVCCEKSNDQWCVYTSQNNCNPSYRISPAKCSEVSFCEAGCCYNQNNGLCVRNSQEAACVQGGGTWTRDDIYCGISQCKEACCLYSDQAIWTTQKHCDEIEKTLGLESEWKQEIKSEIECIMQTKTQEEGACVFEQDFENNCKFTTRAECIRLTGSASSFYKNKLCSNTELNTICKKQERKGCIEGRDEVFWFDSCGNRENIYSSDKAKSWNNGSILTKNQSCGADSGNGNADSKTCGNCDYVKGSICGQEKGDYICKDLSCDVVIDGKTVTKQHGESWCSFDGAIGVGEVTGNNKIARDVVGSRHWRHICIDGEERVEPCEDYRNQVCTEQKEETTGRTYSACRLNEWQECIDMNTREMDAEECEKKTDCWVKRVDVDDFEFNMCVPKYPPGFDTQDSNSAGDAQGICSIGTGTCTVIYTKKTFSSCKPKVNKNCLNPVFTQQMNSLCISLGDCGGYVNIAGEYTDGGYNVKQDNKGKRKDLPQSDINKYISFANALLFPGQFVDPGDLNLIPSYLGALGANVQGPDANIGFIAQLAQYGGYAAAAFLANTAYVALSILMEGGAILLTNPIGWIIFAALVIFYILFGEKVCKKVQVTYNCMPWQPPYGGDNCDKCNGNIFEPCTKYRCQSLGAACEFVNEGTDNELCIVSENDGTSPRINPLLGNISEGYQYKDSNPQGFDSGFEIKPVEGEDDCIPAFTPVEFGIKTLRANGEPKAAQCKFDLQHTETFEDMADYFGGNNLFLYNHSATLSLPSPESLADYFEVPTENILEKYGNLNMYVRCKDTHGNENTAEYSIKMCVKEGPDTTPPYVVSTLPENNGYLKYGETSKNVKIWTNEPAECKYSTSDKDFEQMENSMSCAIHLEDYDLRGGWPCEFNVSDISQEKNIFIRCKDKPWLTNATETDEEKRVAMQQSYKYTLKVSSSELKIDSIMPEQGKEIFVSSDVSTINFEVETSGGAENGKSKCEWQEVNKGWSDFFIETDSSLHKTSLPLPQGDYSFKIICEDKAGNKAEGSTDFRVSVDTSAPKATRVYNSGGLLKIITDEDAVCVYSFNSCKFSFDDEDVELMSGSEKEHSESWQTEQTYYVKCKDYYENSPSRCSIIVRPYDID